MAGGYGTYIGGVDVRPGDVRVEVNGSMRKRQRQRKKAKPLGTITERGGSKIRRSRR